MAKPKVLVVDDSEVGRTLLISQLSYLGYQAEGVENGTIALEKIRTTDYSLVLMDIFMPGLDGIETTRQIRREQKDCPQRKLIIVAVSGGADRQSCLAAGLDDFINKPILLDDLQRVIHRWLTPVNSSAESQPD